MSRKRGNILDQIEIMSWKDEGNDILSTRATLRVTAYSAESFNVYSSREMAGSIDQERMIKEELRHRIASYIYGDIRRKLRDLRESVFDALHAELENYGKHDGHDVETFLEWVANQLGDLHDLTE